MSDPIHILAVDDEPDLELLIRQKLRREIRSGELHFTYVCDGVEALERLEGDDSISLVLTDINMPRMDRLSLLGQITEIDRLLKVVIVSAYGDMANIRTAMNRGAFDFLTKPIRFDDLAFTIQKTHRELEVHRQASRVQRQLTAPQRCSTSGLPRPRGTRRATGTAGPPASGPTASSGGGVGGDRRR